MNIALTGSSGLIGSRLLRDLKRSNHHLICISSSHSLPNENIYSYEDMLAGKISESIDCIIHLASMNSMISKEEIPLEVEIAKKVIEGMDAMRCQKIIFFSTSKVYGDNSFARDIFLENSPLNPLCSYGQAKAECEQVISQFSEDMGYRYIIFRMPPLLINDSKSKIGKLFAAIEKGLPIPSFSKGDSNLRSFLSYEFLYSAIKMALRLEYKLPNKVFNLSNTHPISTNELFRVIGLSFNKNARIIYFPNFLFQAMIKVNRLQLILCSLFGNFNMSNAKLLKEFDLKG